MTILRCFNCNKILAEGDFNGVVEIHCHNNKCKSVNRFCFQQMGIIFDREKHVRYNVEEDPNCLS